MKKYSLEGELSDEEIIKQLVLLNDGIVSIIGGNHCGDFLIIFVNICLRLLQHNNHVVTQYSSLIIGNLSIDNKFFSKLNIEDILNALDIAINIETEVDNLEAYELARDIKVETIGDFIYNQHEFINTSVWVTKW